jgi:glycosyltransferase involved in cell wall biosynthesis
MIARVRPHISVVIPAFNRAHVLGRALESALAQTRHPDEILVVDDCSTDTTRDVLAAWQSREPRVRAVILPDNRGPAGARNAGVAAARGDLIAFLDSDDVWMPDHLNACVGFLEADRELDVAFTDVRRVRESGEVTDQNWLSGTKDIRRHLDAVAGPDRRYRFRFPEFEVLLQDYVVPIQTSVVRAGSAKAFRFNEALRGPEDYDLMLHLARAGKRFGYVDQVGCECFQHETNLVANATQAVRQTGEDIKLWSGLLGDPLTPPKYRVACHHHLARLWHDRGHSAVRTGSPGAAIRAFRRSLWHDPSPRAFRGLARALVGYVRRFASRGPRRSRGPRPANSW